MTVIQEKQLLDAAAKVLEAARQYGELRTAIADKPAPKQKRRGRKTSAPAKQKAAAHA